MSLRSDKRDLQQSNELFTATTRDDDELDTIISKTKHVLNLQKRSLKATPPIAHLTKLRNINLSYNQIQTLPNLSSFGELRELYLSNNKISDDSVSGCGLDKCIKLVKLHFSSNLLSCLPHSFKSLTKLQEFHITNNKLITLTGLGRCTNLTSLDVSANLLTNEAVSSVKTGLNALLNLVTLNISSNQIGLSLPKCILKLKALENLDASHNNITNVNLSEGALGLVEINLNYNQITKIQITSNILPNLQTLKLKSNHIQSLPRLSEVCVGLDCLDVSLNRVDNLESVVKFVVGLDKLKELSVVGNPCTPQASTDGGDRVGKWWYALLKDVGIGGLEVLDEFVCDNDDVKEYIGNTNSDTNTKSYEPVNKPEIRKIRTRNDFGIKLEDIVDVSSQFDDIKARIRGVRTHIKVDNSDKGGEKDEDSVVSAEEKDNDKEIIVRRSDRVEEHRNSPEVSNTTTSTATTTASTTIALAKDESPSSTPTLTPTQATAKRAPVRSSSTVTNILKKANQRIKLAQAYSGTKNAYLSSPSREVESVNQGGGLKNSASAKNRVNKKLGSRSLLSTSLRVKSSPYSSSSVSQPSPQSLSPQSPAAVDSPSHFLNSTLLSKQSKQTNFTLLHGTIHQDASEFHPESSPKGGDYDYDDMGFEAFTSTPRFHDDKDRFERFNGGDDSDSCSSDDGDVDFTRVRPLSERRQLGGWHYSDVIANDLYRNEDSKSGDTDTDTGDVSGRDRSNINPFTGLPINLPNESKSESKEYEYKDEDEGAGEDESEEELETSNPPSPSPSITKPQDKPKFLLNLNFAKTNPTPNNNPNANANLDNPVLLTSPRYNPLDNSNVDVKRRVPNAKSASAGGGVKLKNRVGGGLGVGRNGFRLPKRKEDGEGEGGSVI